MTDSAFNAAWASEYLDPWAADDFDGFRDKTNELSKAGDELMARLDEEQGDARGLVEDLRTELATLAALVDGALRLARDAIDSAVAMRAGPTREAVLADLRVGYQTMT